MLALFPVTSASYSYSNGSRRRHDLINLSTLTLFNCAVGKSWAQRSNANHPEGLKLIVGRKRRASFHLFRRKAQSVLLHLISGKSALTTNDRQLPGVKGLSESFNLLVSLWSSWHVRNSKTFLCDFMPRSSWKPNNTQDPNVERIPGIWSGLRCWYTHACPIFSSVDAFFTCRKSFNSVSYVCKLYVLFSFEWSSSIPSSRCDLCFIVCIAIGGTWSKVDSLCSLHTLLPQHEFEFW